MSAPTGSTAAETWFKRVLWLGILVNLGLAIPTLLVPERIMAMSRLPPAAPLLWPRFAGIPIATASSPGWRFCPGWPASCSFSGFSRLTTTRWGTSTSCSSFLS